MVTYEEIRAGLTAPKHRLDTLGNEYEPFYCDRVFGEQKMAEGAAFCNVVPHALSGKLISCFIIPIESC